MLIGNGNMEGVGQFRYSSWNCRFTLIAVGWVLVLVASGCMRSPIDSAMSVDDFTSYLDQRIPDLMDRFGIPGTAIALIKEGDLIWSEAYGFADLVGEQEMTVDAIFRAESISKPVTAWGVLSLVESGQIDLDTPIDRYLADWRLPASEFDEHAITVRMLLTGSAGLPQGSIGPEVEYAPGSDKPSLRDFLSSEAFLAQQPGQGFSYSNVGFNLLQLIIENVTGRAFHEYMCEEVLLPLGMSNSNFIWMDEYQLRMPNGYEMDGTAVAPYVYPAQASGGLFTTVGDLAKFVIAGMVGQFEADQTVIGEDSVRSLHSPWVPMTGIFSLVADGYGFGHFSEDLSDGNLAVWHGGQGHGWMTHFHAIPETGAGIVVLTNSERSWPFFAELLMDWARWNGVKPVGFGIITYANTAIDLVVGVILIVSIGQFIHLARGLYLKQRRFAPLHLRAAPKRLFEFVAGAALMTALAWAAAQPYLFVTAIFPIAAQRAFIALMILAVGLVGKAYLPVRGNS